MSAQDQVRMERMIRQAEGYLELGMPQHTLDTLDRLGQRAERSAAVLYLRGEALRTLERYPEAIEPLERAAKLEQENIHVWLAIGWCRKRTARIDLAVKALERALQADPDEPLLHYNLACYLSLMGEKERTLSHLSRALAIDSRFRELIPQEPDFDPIRSDPDFQALTSIIV